MAGVMRWSRNKVAGHARGLDGRMRLCRPKQRADGHRVMLRCSVDQVCALIRRHVSERCPPLLCRATRMLFSTSKCEVRGARCEVRDARCKIHARSFVLRCPL